MATNKDINNAFRELRQMGYQALRNQGEEPGDMSVKWIYSRRSERITEETEFIYLDWNEKLIDLDEVIEVFAKHGLQATCEDPEYKAIELRLNNKTKR